jgi:hypothetical protein
MLTTKLLAAGLMAAALAGCGSGTTLNGTFDESLYANPGGHAPCAAEELSGDPAATWKVRVAADNVTVGTTTVQWSGKPDSAGACTASWSMSVPAASKAYRVTLIAKCSNYLDGNMGDEKIASVIIQPSAAGQAIRLSDGSTGGDNC